MIFFIQRLIIILLLFIPAMDGWGELWAQSGKNNGSIGAGQPQVFRAIYPTAPLNLDPQGLPDEAAWPIIMAAYDRLMALKPGTAEPTPSLARRVIVSPDGLKYTFFLNEGMTFADGTAINTDAAYFTFDRLMSSEVGRRYYPHLYGFEPVGQYTFMLKLRRPWPPFLASLTLPMASLVSPGLQNRSPEYLTDRTLGSGQYQVYDWKGDTIGLKVRPDLRSKPPVAFAMFHYEADGRKRYEKMLAHHAHLTLNPAPPSDGTSLPTQYRQLEAPTFSARYLAFNTRRPYTRMQNARRAMGFLISDIFKDRPSFMTGLFPDGLFYNSPAKNTASPSLEEKAAQGRNILREVGPPAGALVLAYPSDVPQVMEDAIIIAQTLIAYGFSINMVSLDGEKGRQIMENGDYDLFLGTRTPKIPSADMWLAGLLDATSSAESNPAFFNHGRANQLIAEIAAAVGRPEDGPNDIRRVERERAGLLADLAEIAVIESPYVFLYQLWQPMVIDERLTNLRPHPMWPEVWPLDQTNLVTASLKSGVNPTGKRPAAQAQTPAPIVKPAVPAPATPTVPVPPAPEASAAQAEPPADRLAPIPEPPAGTPPAADDPYDYLPPAEDLSYDDFYVPEDLIQGDHL